MKKKNSQSFKFEYFDINQNQIMTNFKNLSLFIELPYIGIPIYRRGVERHLRKLLCQFPEETPGNLFRPLQFSCRDAHSHVIQPISWVDFNFCVRVCSLNFSTYVATSRQSIICIFFCFYFLFYFFLFLQRETKSIVY